jgi:hypothetical protein
MFSVLICVVSLRWIEVQTHQHLQVPGLGHQQYNLSLILNLFMGKAWVVLIQDNSSNSGAAYGGCSSINNGSRTGISGGPFHNVPSVVLSIVNSILLCHKPFYSQQT